MNDLQEQLNAACAKNLELNTDNELLYNDNEKLRARIRELEKKISELLCYVNTPPCL